MAFLSLFTFHSSTCNIVHLEEGEPAMVVTREEELLLCFRMHHVLTLAVGVASTM